MTCWLRFAKLVGLPVDLFGSIIAYRYCKYIRNIYKQILSRDLACANGVPDDAALSGQLLHESERWGQMRGGTLVQGLGRIGLEPIHLINPPGRIRGTGLCGPGRLFPDSS